MKVGSIGEGEKKETNPKLNLKRNRKKAKVKKNKKKKTKKKTKKKKKTAIRTQKLTWDVRTTTTNRKFGSV